MFTTNNHMELILKHLDEGAQYSFLDKMLEGCYPDSVGGEEEKDRNITSIMFEVNHKYFPNMDKGQV